MNCIPMPLGVDELTAAALGCRYMTSWRPVVDRANLRGGESVAVHGCGGVGLAAVQIAAALGGRVVAIDIDDGKLATAKEAGAFATVNVRGLNPSEVGLAVKQAAGNSESMWPSTRLVAPERCLVGCSRCAKAGGLPK
jgi:D-arabinose 1-dehydrogenase-like Zn-dependent alcohol dehydrogenase